MTLLISATGNLMVPAYYLILVGALGLVTVLTIRETRGVDLLGEDLAARAGERR